jgi:hypothetical protein
VPYPFDRVAQVTPEGRDRAAAHLAQFAPLELLPEACVRVQRRGIGRQALPVKAWRRAGREDLLEGRAAVNRRAIPDAHPPAGALAPQMLANRDDVVRMEGTVLAVAVHLTRRRDRAAGRQLGAGAPLPHNGRLAPGRRGAHDPGQGIATGFVSEAQRLLLRLRPLLRAGPGSARQRALAASARGWARRPGFWGLQRRAVRRRPTGVGCYTTPHATRSTSTTRCRGQTGPRHPSAAGLRRHKAGRRASGSAARRRGAPGDGRWRQAWRPPARARCPH